MAKADTIIAYQLGDITNLTIFNKEVESNPEVVLIDKLANEYYNYYVNNGVTQDNGGHF